MTNQHLIKTYSDRQYLYTSMVRHKGTVVTFAMDGARRIYYAVLNLGSGDESRGELDVNYWPENPASLPFPAEITEVGYAIAGSTEMPTVKAGSRAEDSSGLLLREEIDSFLSSTARLSASAPFQVISDGACIYVFRQSIDNRHPDTVCSLKGGGSSADTRRRDYVRDASGRKVALVHNTLLVDRYVLVGAELQLLLDVRYQRSRHKTLPASTKDTLGVKDMDGVAFCEPTQSLSLVRNLERGRFTVGLLPTQIPDMLRWQIFAYNAKTQRLDSFNIERDSDGLFNTQGTQYYTSPDPQYQDAVFERAPGKCPFSGQDLVPVVSESDYAETALSFDGVDDCVDLGTPAALGFQNGAYTIEAWVKNQGNGWLLTKWNEGVSGTFALKLTSTGKVSVVHSATPSEVQSSISLAPGEFNHIAVTYDKSTQKCMIYINGEPAGSGTLGFAPSNDRVMIGGFYYGGKPSGFFSGTIDELRIWDRALTLDELGADMKHRLIGNEPGLTAYYRFDEGEGARLYDQTDNACHGDIRGGAAWVTSNADVGDHPGVRRDSFGIAGRTVESGLASELYYMQESSSSGYGETDKPVKRQARMLLAFATRGADPSGGATTKQYIATLDFAVARDGRLALTPDVVTLPFLGANESSGSLDAAAALEASIGRLEGECGDLRAAIDRLLQDVSPAAYAALLSDKQRADDKVLSLQTAYDSEKNVFGAYFYTLQSAYNNKYIGVINGSKDLGTRLNQYVTSDAQYTHFRFNLYQGEWYTIAARHSGKVLDVTADASYPRGWPLQWDVHYGDNQLFHLRTYDGKVFGKDFPLTPTDVEKLPFHVQVKSSGNNIDTGASDGVMVWMCEVVNVDWHRLKVRRVGLISGVDLALQAAKDDALRLAKQLAVLDLKKVELDTKTSDLSARQQELTRLRSQLAVLTGGLSGDEVSFQSQLLYIDRQGLTVTGGLLGFAYTSHAPCLFDSATGDVILYFRGQTGGFYACYYSTRSSSGSLRLAMGNNRSLTLFGRTPGLDLGEATLLVSDGSKPETCTLTITKGAYSEIFPDVPRAASQFAAVLNGDPGDATHIGVIAQNAMNSDTLVLSQGTTQVLQAGSLLQVGGATGRLTQDAPVGATQLKLASALRRIVAGATVDLIQYDYDSAMANRPGSTLSAGSLILTCFAGARTDLVPNGTTTQGNVAQACAWRSDAPGRAFDFSGDRPSLEMAWPPIAVPSAVSLDGEADYLLLGNSYDLRLSSFTIELWYRRDATGRDDFIVSHGDDSGEPLRNLFIGFRRDNFFTFSFLSDKLDSKVAYTDTDWHHFAVVYDFKTGTRSIYRDGELINSLSAPVAYIGQGRLTLGRFLSKSGPQFAKGSVDRVRLWNIACSGATISANYKSGPLPATPGLLAQWTFDGGLPKWDAAGSSPPTAVFGAPQSIGTYYQIENTMSEEALAAAAPLGDLTIESWLNPYGFDGRRRVLYHQSNAGRYTLALEGIQAQKKDVVSLDGVDDCFTIGSGLILKGADFSIELWVKRQRSGAADVLFDVGDPAAGDTGRFTIGFTQSDALAFAIGQYSLITPVVYTDLEWHHYAFTYQASTQKRQIFRDGALVAADTSPVGFLGSGSAKLGGLLTLIPSSYGKVLFDELRIWNKVRSAADLVSTLNRCLTGQESGVLRAPNKTPPRRNDRQ